MSIDLHADPRTNTVLNAALAVFARYGFKRVSMEDIALEATMSRPALYLIYPNKAAIFTGLAKAMADRACALCDEAWPQTESFETGLARAAIVLNLDAWRLIKGSPHGHELVADNSAVVGEISLAVDTHFKGLIEARLIETGHAGTLARVIASALHGIKDKATSEDDLVATITRFATVITAGLNATLPA
jgi:AcrR family transcriptional regulator